MSEKEPSPPEASKEEEMESPPVSSPPADRGSDATPSSVLETLATPNLAAAPAADCRSFSQLLAGAMASPAASPRTAPILAVPVDAVRVPVVAVPCFLAPAALLDSPGFTGQFTMTHQAVLATVTAQAQMQLQAAYPPPSDALTNAFPQPTIPSPMPLQQKPLPVPEDNVSTPEPKQPPPPDQKSESTHIVVKTSSNDGYNWRKYGQKQVKSSDRSRSYYKCTNADCFAKKKVERCPDGRETEIIYRGQHNHKPPKKTRSSKERGPQSSGPVAENESLDPPSSEVHESDPSTSKAEQLSGNETPEQRLYCSSDCEGDAAVKTEEDPGDEPDPKRRLSENTNTFSPSVLKTVKEPRIVVQSSCDAGRVSDGYRWRKYGQKIVKGNPNPRSYYRCTHDGCPVRKHVERASDDDKAVVITYEGRHNHDQPALKSGSEQPATALLIAAAAAVTKDEQAHTSNSSVDHKPPTDGDPSRDKALELGGEKALESAQTLLSIGFNSSSGEQAGGGTNSDGVNRPLFSENCAPVPVQNS